MNNNIMTFKNIFPLLFVITQQAFGQSIQVTELTSLPNPVSNNAVSGGYIDGRKFIYSFSGIDSTKVYSGIHLNSYKYDVTNGQWSILPDLPDTLGKIAASASTIDSIIYIIGGYHVFSNNHEVSTNKVHRFNINTNTYLSDGANIPVAIDDHVQTIYKDSLIFVVAGWSNTTNVPNVQVYDPTSDQWLAGTSVPNNSAYKSFGSSGAIIGDTLYYFGGAAIGFNFPAQSNFRKGYINPNDPLDITWINSVPDPQIKGYRMACTRINNKVNWIGGSEVTYNYNGIAYNGSGGVSPLNRSLVYDPSIGEIINESTSGVNLPMDLRGIAEFNDGTRYIVGGLEDNQRVSNKTLLLINFSVGLNEKNKKSVSVYPNPTKGKASIINRASVKRITIYNIQGEVMKVMVNSGQIDLSPLSNGTYYLYVEDQNGGLFKEKLIKY